MHVLSIDKVSPNYAQAVAYSEPCLTSKMERFTKIVKG